MKSITIAQALRIEMIQTGADLAWAGDPDLLLSAYEKSAGTIVHPLARIAAARKSTLFKQDGYIRAFDSTGRREVLYPCFKLAQPQEN